MRYTLSPQRLSNILFDKAGRIRCVNIGGSAVGASRLAYRSANAILFQRDLKAGAAPAFLTNVKGHFFAAPFVLPMQTHFTGQLP